jgi:ABC-type glycerol-3-phosphate transport system permease component
VISVVFLFPLYLMISGSLRPAGGPPPRTPDLVPSTLALENYSRAFELVDIPRYIVNSLIVYVQYRIVKRWRHAFVV